MPIGSIYDYASFDRIKDNPDVDIVYIVLPNSNREPHTPGEEGLQDQKIQAAIYEAAAGGSVVRLPASTGLDVTRGPLPASEAG